MGRRETGTGRNRRAGLASESLIRPKNSEPQVGRLSRRATWLTSRRWWRCGGSAVPCQRVGAANRQFANVSRLPFRPASHMLGRVTENSKPSRAACGNGNGVLTNSERSHQFATRHGERSGHFLSSPAAHSGDLSAWQTLQAFGTFDFSVSAGGTNRKV
jgi:hypothetical protein